VRTARPRSGFTLIELLVVVAIIALLIAILLPTLQRAREQSRATVCLSNVKQLTQSFFLYAEEYGSIPGGYWQGQINTDWCGINNDKYQDNPDAWEHPIETSVLYPYISGMDEILECPTGQREANTFFDYTMIIRMAGARTDLPWKMTYPGDMHDVRHSQLYFQALPFLIEEDAYFYNNNWPWWPYSSDDGSWANLDQFTDRHFGVAHLGYLDGSAGQFISPKGGNPEVQEPWDLIARHLQLWVDDRPYPVWYSQFEEFGWANRPH
jgi:prepilin-type N-terminal cleavage/methylation domain-containing protein